jgi:Histidine phosphatase superfamily (branch 1)
VLCTRAVTSAQSLSKHRVSSLQLWYQPVTGLGPAANDATLLFFCTALLLPLLLLARSYLKRAIKTCWHALEQTDQMHIPIVNAWQLNERHYGALTGLDKQETVAKHGKEQVLVWRRSYDIPPPPLDTSSEHYPGNDPKYAALSKDQLPVAESLATTLDRVLPYWEKEIAPRIKAGEKIIVSAFCIACAHSVCIGVQCYESLMLSSKSCVLRDGACCCY